MMPLSGPMRQALDNLANAVKGVEEAAVNESAVFFLQDKIKEFHKLIEIQERGRLGTILDRLPLHIVLGVMESVAEVCRRDGYGNRNESTRYRIGLILEEAAELIRALQSENKVKILHESCDLAYVAAGAAVEQGLPFDAGMQELHKANMTKTNRPQDRHRGPNTIKPDMDRVIKENS